MRAPPAILILTITLVFIHIFSACSTILPTQPENAQQGQNITAETTLLILAAASLSESFVEIGLVFEKSHPGVHVIFNFAGSQQLAQQIVQGAPADVFASANQKHMDVVISDGRIQKGSDQPFANNRLIVILPNENHADILTLQDLAKPGLRLVVAAEEVPVGLYSQEFLSRTVLDASFDPDYKEKVMANVVSYENNVKAVVSKVILGEADAGIVYTSDSSENNAKNILQLPIPDNLNVTAVYPIAPLKDSHHPMLTKAFIDFVISPEGQEILARHGLIALGP